MADPGFPQHTLTGGEEGRGEKGERARGVAWAQPIIQTFPSHHYFQARFLGPELSNPLVRLRLGRGQSGEAGVGTVNGYLDL